MVQHNASIVLIQLLLISTLCLTLVGQLVQAYGSLYFYGHVTERYFDYEYVALPTGSVDTLRINPTKMCTDGGFIYFYDKDQNSVRRLNYKKSTIDKSIALTTNYDITAMDCDGGIVYLATNNSITSVDISTKTVQLYAGSYTQNGDKLTSPLNTRFTDITKLHASGGRLYALSTCQTTKTCIRKVTTTAVTNFYSSTISTNNILQFQVSDTDETKMVIYFEDTTLLFHQTTDPRDDEDYQIPNLIKVSFVGNDVFILSPTKYETWEFSLAIYRFDSFTWNTPISPVDSVCLDRYTYALATSTWYIKSYTKTVSNTILAGIGQYPQNGDHGLQQNALIETPSGIAYRGDYIYISEESVKRLRQVKLSTGIVTTLTYLTCEPGRIRMAKDGTKMLIMCKVTSPTEYITFQQFTFATSAKVKFGTLYTAQREIESFAYDDVNSTVIYYLVNEFDGNRYYTSDVKLCQLYGSTTTCKSLPKTDDDVWLHGDIDIYKGVIYLNNYGRIMKINFETLEITKLIYYGRVYESQMFITNQGTMFIYSKSAIFRFEGVAKPTNITVAKDFMISYATNFKSITQLTISDDYSALYIVDNKYWVEKAENNGCCVSKYKTSATQVEWVDDFCDISCYGIKASNSSVCSGSGSCTAYLETATDLGVAACDCFTGYSGKYCESFTCNGYSKSVKTGCNGHGTCIDLNTCKCDTGYTGARCDVFTCSGVAATSSSVCGGNRKCIGPNICEPTCYGIAASQSTVCSGQGTCASQDNCKNCAYGRYGNMCQYSIPCASGNLTCENGGNCTYSKGKEVCVCPPGFAGKTCDPGCKTNNNCSDPYFPICSVAEGICTYECLSDDDCATVPGRPTCEIGYNEYDMGGRCIPGCTNDAQCKEKGLQYCNDGTCSNYQCDVDSDCVPHNYSQCFESECRDECTTDAECLYLGAYSVCGIIYGSATYHRCIAKTCKSDVDCANPTSGNPKCDLGSNLCIKADCSQDSDCYSYGYSVCSNNKCSVQCLSNSDCTVQGFKRCGLNSSDITSYRRCLPTCDASCEVCADDGFTCLKCTSGFDLTIGKCVSSSNNSTKPSNNTNPINPVNNSTDVNNSTTNPPNPNPTPNNTTVVKNNTVPVNTTSNNTPTNNTTNNGTTPNNPPNPTPNVTIPCTLKCVYGVCQNVSRVATCKCSPGYYGNLCAIKNPCTLNCSPLGTCVNGTGSAICNCFESGGYHFANNKCERNTPECSNCENGVCSYVNSTSPSTYCKCNSGYITTDLSKPCKSCDSTLKLVLDENGLCVCDAANGYVLNALGLCVKYTAKCPVTCGANGACQLITPTTSDCVCKNGFITKNLTKPCTSCPVGRVQYLSSCVCDEKNGFTGNSSKCFCDASKGYIANGDSCACNSDLNFVKNNLNQCECKLNYQLTNGVCTLIPPLCPCKYGTCYYENVNSSTRTHCVCDQGYTSNTYSKLACSDCSYDYKMDSNGICKKLCTFSGYLDDCKTFIPTSFNYCGLNDYLPLEKYCGLNLYTAYKYHYLKQNYTGTNFQTIKWAIDADFLKGLMIDDSLARNKSKAAIAEVINSGRTCDSTCVSYIRDFYCEISIPRCYSDSNNNGYTKPFCLDTCKYIWNNVLNFTQNLDDRCAGFSSQADQCNSGPFINPLTTCNGIHYLNSSVCSGRGKCQGKDSCKCDYGYGGKNCELFSCFMYNSDDPFTCSKHGSCIGPNICSCNKYFGGDSCKIPYCNGKSEKQGGCSFNGACVEISDRQTVCKCNTYSGHFSPTDKYCSICAEGWGGAGCDSPVCNGIPGNNKAVCGGHGFCAIDKTTSKTSCVCTKGYDGPNCQNFKCDGIDRNSSLVCSGHGTCTGVDTCVCQGNFAANKFCSECTPAYNGTDCTERVCTDEITCHGNGVCNAYAKCECKPNFTGQFCDTCVFGLVGPACDIKCNAISNCNGKGTCSNNGSCLCFGNSQGPKCETCKDGWYGDRCEFSIDVNSFGFSSNGDSISGTVYSSLKKSIACSDLIRNSSKLGDGPICILNSDSNLLTITLGKGATVAINDVFLFKAYFNSQTTVIVPISTMSYVPTAPTATLTADKTTISRACGYVYLDASGSSSSDRRPLRFSWSVQSAPSVEDGIALKSVLDASAKSGVKINSYLLGVGTYIVQVQVTSTFSGEYSTASVSFKITDLPAPIITIPEGTESTMTIGTTYIISHAISLPSCYSGTGAFQYSYALNPRSVAQIELVQKQGLLIFSDDYTKVTQAGDYFITLTVSQTGATSVVIPLKVTAVDLSLRVSFSIKDRIQSYETDLSFTITKLDPSNPTNSTGTVTLACLDLDNGGGCAGFSETDTNIDQNTLAFSRQMQVGNYMLTATYSKGYRTASSSVKVTIIDKPKSSVIVVSISAPKGSDLTAIDPSSDLILQAYSSDVLSTARVYTWSSVDFDLTGITTSNKYILIPKNLLVPGTSHVVNLNVVDGDRSGDSTISFTINSPPTIGELEVYPETGVALQDEFQIKCGNGWSDPQLPLTFEFRYRVVGDSAWKVLSKISEKKAIASQLPAGQIEIKAIAYDSLSASSETTFIVTVSVPSLGEALSALNVSQMGTVSVASVSSALSLISGITTSSPEEKAALEQANKNLVDKFFDQQDAQSQIVSETSQSASSKVSVISSISNCLSNFPDETVSKVIDQLSTTISTASSASNVDIKGDDLQNSKEAASNIKEYVSSSVSKRAITAFTKKDLEKIDSIYNNIVKVELKNVVADMPAIRSSGVDSSIYARLVSISTLSSLSGLVDDTKSSSSSFEMKNVFNSMKRFENVDSVKIITKVSKLTNSSLNAFSKVFDFIITQNEQAISLASENVTLATLKIEKIKTSRSISQLSCYSLQNNVYVLDPNCKVINSNGTTVDIAVNDVGSYIVAEHLVSNSITPPQTSTSTTKPADSTSVITPLPITNQNNSNLNYIILILLIVPIVLVVLAILVCVICLVKRKKKKAAPIQQTNELEMRTC